MSTDNKDDKSERWLSEEDYTRYREALQKSEQEMSDEFDKVMISLAGGALAISITFINQIAPDPKSFWLCISAWIGFTLALLCTLLSLGTSREAMTRQVKDLDRVFADGGKFKKNSWDTGTVILNNAAISSFIVGVAFLIFFVAKQ